MPKRTKIPPRGYYTANEAAKRLKLPLATFYVRYRGGKIKAEKWAPKGYTEGFYSKRDIDEIAQEQELVELLHSEEPIIFDRVRSEDDIRGIVDLCVAIYGQEGTPSYDARYEIWQKNPEVYYIVRQGDIVVGYISLIWFDEEALETLMGPTQKKSYASSAGNGIYSVTGPEHILPFIEGQPIGSLFISLGVRTGMSNSEQRGYAVKLLRGTQDVLSDFARRGMPVQKLYGTSERGDGINLAQRLGMKETRYPGDKIRRYELDLETSDHPLLLPYRQALDEWKSRSH